MLSGNDIFCNFFYPSVANGTPLIVRLVNLFGAFHATNLMRYLRVDKASVSGSNFTAHTTLRGFVNIELKVANDL